MIPNQALVQMSPRATFMNALWFISLIFSIGTAALGISCLQWLREHQKQPNKRTAEAFAVRVLRIKMLDNWGVPHAIAVLHSFLLISLSSFLVGLAIFLIDFRQLLISLVSSIVLAVFLLFPALTILPAIHTDCALRTPQAWLSRIVLINPLERLTSDTAVERALCHLFARLSPLVSFSARRFWNFGDWSPSFWELDKERVEKTRDFGFYWFAKAFAHDREAIQALVECVDAKIGESKTDWTAEEMEKDIKIRVSEMVSLRAGKPFAVRDPNYLAQWPSGMAYDIAMASCIDYATAMHPSLISTFLVRRSELQLRILSTAFLSGCPFHTTGVVLSTVQHFKSGHREHLLHDESLSQGG